MFSSFIEFARENNINSHHNIDLEIITDLFCILFGSVLYVKCMWIVVMKDYNGFCPYKFGHTRDAPDLLNAWEPPRSSHHWEFALQIFTMNNPTNVDSWYSVFPCFFCSRIIFDLHSLLWVFRWRSYSLNKDSSPFQWNQEFEPSFSIRFAAQLFLLNFSSGVNSCGTISAHNFFSYKFPVTQTTFRYSARKYNKTFVQYYKYMVI